MAELRRQFELPEFDREFLESRGLRWETVVERDMRWLVVHEYPVSTGYNVSQASVALQIPASYPDTQIDMAYFFPSLVLVSGRAIPQLTGHAFDGNAWQRWSRHRTEQNPWRRDYDCVETHLLLVDEWLERIDTDAQDPPAVSAAVSSSSIAMRLKVSRTCAAVAIGSGLPFTPSGFT